MTRKSRKTTKRAASQKRDRRSGVRTSGSPEPPARPTGGLRGLVERPWFWPVAVFVAAFALRTVYILQVRYTPFFQTLGLDAKFYDRWAREIATGSGHAGAFFMTPLYSYFLAAVYRLFGRDLMLVRMIQAGIGSLTAVLVYFIGRGVFDRRVGILSGFVTASYGALIFYDGSVLLTPLLVFLNVLAVYLLVRSDETGRPAEYAAAGAALGLAAVGRAAALVSAAAAVLWVWLSGGGEKRPSPSSGRSAAARAAGGRRSGAARAALVVLGIVVVIAPVTIRNYAVERDFVPITSNGGLNFFIGNGAGATGGYVKPEGLDIVSDPDGSDIAERALGRALKPSEVSGFWYARARSDIAADPARWFRLVVKKLSFVLSSYELPQLENFYFQKRYSPLLMLPLPGFALVAPLGLVGLGLALRRRRPRLLGLYAVTYMLAIAAFFVVARYRLPAVPLLIVFASYALFELGRRVMEKKLGSLVWPLAGLAALLVVVNANFYDIDREKGFAQPHFRLGIIYAQRGLTDEAVAEYEAAIRLDPSYSKSYLNLGAVLSEAGRADEARDAFRKALRLNPSYTAARVNLAMLLEGEGRYEAAVAQVDSALAHDPHDAMALKERGVILYHAGRTGEAGDWLREALKWDDGTERPEIEFYLGLLEGSGGRDLPQAAAEAMAAADSLAPKGRVVEAISELERAAALAPESGEPLRKLALLKRDMGLLDEALELMDRALRLDPTLKEGHYMYGVFLNEAGRHDEAIREYDAETRMNPDFAPAHLNLALTYNFYAGNPNLAAFHYRRYLALGGGAVPQLDEVLREIQPPEGF